MFDPWAWEEPLGKEMATHSSILDWEIPWTEEPGRLQSMGSHRVRHDLVTKQEENMCVLSTSSFYSKQDNFILNWFLREVRHSRGRGGQIGGRGP